MEAGKHFEVSVFGSAFSQRIDNTFYFSNVNNDVSLTTALTQFRATWRAEILPLLSTAYQVVMYEIREITGYFWLTIPGVVNRTRWGLRYEGTVRLTGVAVTDAGGVAGAALPTYAAVTVNKACAAPTASDYTPVLGLKSMRGAARFGVIPEADTQVADGNKLETAKLADWVAAMEELRELGTGGADYLMEVIGTTIVGQDLTPPAAPLGPDMRRAFVTGITVSPFISSQVSRKQTVANLG